MNRLGDAGGAVTTRHDLSDSPLPGGVLGHLWGGSPGRTAEKAFADTPNDDERQVHVTRRTTTATAVLCATGALIGLGAAGVGARTTTTRTGQADSGTAYISTVRTVGNTSWSAGLRYDKLHGQGALVNEYTLTPQKNGSFKLNAKRAITYGGTGSLSGTASAIITLKGTAETISHGKIDLTHGAGSQKGHSLVGTFTGTGSTATNRATIHYKGTYR